jgi:hypothetical protein
LGFVRYLKQKLIEQSINRRKAEAVFDAGKADLYELPAGAEEGQNHSHYFSLHSFDTKECLFFRYARRGGNDADELWFVYRDADGTVYMQENDHVKKGEKAPCRVEPSGDGKTLRFYYDGFVRRGVPDGKNMKPEGAALPLTCEGEFSGATLAFEFSHHMPAGTTARALSYEKLSKDFVKTLSSIHQTHYEQAGSARARITVDGTERNLKLPAIRDHSFGTREWDYMDRYVWTCVLLENGDFVHTHLVRYPAVKHLQAGLVFQGGRVVHLDYATPLEDVPATGGVPENFAIEAVYTDGTKRRIEWNLDFAVPFLFKGDFLVNEGVSAFVINGVRGRGITEFSYNRDRARWGV